MSASSHSPKILIDGVFFQLARTGIARVWTALLREWAADPFGRHLLVLDRGETAPRIDGIQHRSLPLYDYRTSGEDAARLQAICDEERAEVFVSTYYTTPLTTPSVFVAYDMIPEVYAHELDTPMWREKHYGVQHASAHVAISHSTARDLAKFFPEVDVQTVVVAHPGVGVEFRSTTAEEVEQFRKCKQLEKPYFILVGSRAGFNGYKNAALFFQAFRSLPERHRLTVLCVGGEAALEPALQTYVDGTDVRVIQLSDDELRAAYSGAVALAYPSRYEGFGLPVLEAMACGCPVITCQNSSLVEVAGDAALFTPEDDVAAMVLALQQVQKDEVRDSLQSAGLRQATKFSWRTMATTLAEVLRATAAQGCRPARLWSEFRRLQAAAQERDALGWYLRKLESDLKKMYEKNQQAYYELGETKALVEFMQSSSFWKMRNAYFDSKKAIRDLADRWLPHRAG